jgi:hypothetical protein
LASKASHALFSTKQHVDAVTAQMVGLGRSWADADSLVTAFVDEECTQARKAYLESKN